MNDQPAPTKTATCVLCKACRFYKINPSHMCDRWNYGYTEHPLARSSDIIVENDEGWGADMGPDFGCVLGELKADAIEVGADG